MFRVLVPRLAGAAAVLAAAVAFGPRPADAGMIDIGFNWTVTAPDGYDVAVDGMKGKSRPFPNTTTVALPFKLNVAAWKTLDPVELKFSGPADGGGSIDRFMMTMEVTNATGLAWRGFRFDVKDAQIDHPNTLLAQRGSLFHPDRAHYHTDKILPAAVGFEDYLIDRHFYNDKDDKVLKTSNPTLDDGRGDTLIEFRSKKYLVNDKAKWKPFYFDAANPDDPDKSSLLDIHLHFTGREKLKATEFTLVLQPLAVPEPASVGLVGAGVVAVAVRLGWRRGRRATGPDDGFAGGSGGPNTRPA